MTDLHHAIVNFRRGKPRKYLTGSKVELSDRIGVGRDSFLSTDVASVEVAVMGHTVSTMLEMLPKNSVLIKGESGWIYRHGNDVRVYECLHGLLQDVLGN